MRCICGKRAVRVCSNSPPFGRVTDCVAMGCNATFEKTGLEMEDLPKTQIN